MATEIVLIPLKKGISPADVNSPPGQAWEDVIDTIARQDGFQRGYWGTQIENQDILRLFVDWDSVESHKNFIDSEQYEPFFDRLKTIMDGNPTLYHTHFNPHPANTALSNINAPATEILTYYFPLDYSPADQQSVEEAVKKFVALTESHADEYKGSAAGWVIEGIDIPGTTEKGKAYVIVIGWSSVEAHTAYRDTTHFKDSIGLLRGFKDVKKSSLVHASLKEFQG